MRLQNPFATLSPTGIDSQVLTVLARSDQSLTVAQIAALLPEVGSEPGVRLSVSRLVDQGIVTQIAVGRSRGFLLNREHLLADAVELVARAKSRLLERIAQAVAAWPVPPLTVVLFGSAARGDMNTESDIDLLIVSPDDVDEATHEACVSRLARDVSTWTGNDTRPLVYVESEVEPHPVFESIVKEGIPLFGDRHWLRKRLKRAVSCA